MIATTVWIAWLALRRDRVACLLTFVLPPLLFLAFAAIFSNAPGRDVTLKLVVADLARTPATGRLLTALETTRALRVIPLDHGTAAEVADLVRRGTGDAGLVVAADLGAPGTVPPLVVVQSPERPLAASMALGQVQRAIADALPDVLLRRVLDDLQATEAIDADDRAFLDKAFARKASEQASEQASAQAGAPAKRSLAFARLGRIEPLPAGSGSGGSGGVLQYAAAVSAIFLLFGAIQGAYGLIDERENGLADRLRLAPGGMRGALTGRLLFLIAQGTAQVSLVYLTAFLVYGASFPVAQLPLWLAAVLAATAACAGLALLACAVSRTRRQAELWTTFAVLLLSALGGSMVPRYLMPAWLQAASWWTPNAWIMHGLGQAVLPGGDLASFAVTIGVMGAIAAVASALTLATA